jgi:hypothetical protein
MAAGLGYKEFATGDVLTAADANGYLASQVVMVFASAAARTSAITSPQEGMISFRKDADALEYYSGSSWVAVDTGTSPLTTKGDLFTFSTINARLGVGANGTILTADSAEATGLKWATPAAASSGLNLITRTSFSAVTEQDFTSVFTATYPTYRVVIEKIGGSVSSATLRFQYRTSGGNTANDYYGAVGRAVFNATTYGGTNNTNNGASLQIAASDIGTTSDGHSLSFDVYQAGISGNARISGTGCSVIQGELYFLGGYRNATQTTTGFRLFASSGTITGTVAIYGYGA